jgi:virginiamycin B lyase
MSRRDWARCVSIASCTAALIAVVLPDVAAANTSGTPSIANPGCRSLPRDGIAGDAATAALRDGTVWYANRSGNRLTRINPDRSLTPFVPTDGATAGLSAIVAGSDGTIWYAKDGANRIGRIPPGGGQGVEFELPRKNSFPVAMTLDRSGAVWFAASSGNYIGRVGADGAVTVHAPPKQGSLDFTPQHLTLGPDGNLWMTDRGHNAIYRYALAAGQFSRFDIATPRAHPARIRPGTDGNLWFTMTAARKVGRITPQGAITEFDVGDLAGGTPRDVVATPDGSVWFSASGPRSGRILPNGRVETFACGGNLNTALLGPDQRPWFFGGDRLVLVEDANAPQTARTAAVAPVSASPWPVAAPAATAGATPPPFIAMRLSEAIERLPRTQGRVVLQLTSTDPNCPFCVQHNPVVERIAARHTGTTQYWRVAYEPWMTVGDDANVRAAGIAGLPALIVFESGQETGRLVGFHDAAQTEALIVPRGN